MKQRIMIALGGNAIQNKGEKGTYEEQYNNVLLTMKNIAPLVINDKYEVIITHGNGPQVGSILIQNASAEKVVPSMPMFVCGSMSQGQIGFLIQQSLSNLLVKSGKKREITTIVTQVVVDDNDKAFQFPTKPVGPFYTQKQADESAVKTGYTFKEDAGRGYRRVVASPEPLDIIEIKTIRSLVNNGVIVIAAGGGGIPVVNKNNQLHGVDAVIDKDKAGALMADLLTADLFIILTAVEKVYLNFGTDKESALDNATISEAKKYLQQGHFAEGSMKPKIEAVIKFIEGNPQRKALITSVKELTNALERKTGTWITA